jgi:hypothetical protein
VVIILWNVEAVQEMIDAMPSQFHRSPLAAMALTLASELDSSSNGGTSKSMVAKSMQDVLKELRELAPLEQAKDDVDDLREQRRKRLAGRAAAQNQ